MEEPVRSDDLSSLFLFFWHWRRWIIFSALGTGLLALLLSSPIITKPKYEAEAVLFAAKNNSSERQMADQEFGYDVEADRLIQILMSNSLRDSILRKFQLASHYDIDTTQKFGKEKLVKEYLNNISFERTQFMSVAIHAKDQDANIAAGIANSMTSLADEIRTAIMKKNSSVALEAAKREYENKLHFVSALHDSIEHVYANNSVSLLGKLSAHYSDKEIKLKNISDSLSKLRKKNNIYDYGEEVNILNRQLALAKFNYELESGKLAVFEKSYNDKDTTLINTKARQEGAHKQVLSIQASLKELTSSNQDYQALISRFNTEEKILDDVQPMYENQKYTFDPQVVSALSATLLSSYNEEVTLLNTLLEKYERIKQIYNEPVSGVYVISKAEPNLLKKSPSMGLNAIIGFFLGGMMAIIIILVSEKVKQLKVKYNATPDKILENISREAREFESKS